MGQAFFGDLSSTIRAKRGPKLPVVLTIEEVRQLFSCMEGKQLLIAQILYGAGLRLMELARLRIKDIDFGSGLIFVRSSKGDKDRSTILPGAVREPLQQHLIEVKALHNQDLAKGFGAVYMPDALDRKYPNAPKDWAWQYVLECRNDHDLHPCHAGHDHSTEKPAGSPHGRFCLPRTRRTGAITIMPSRAATSTSSPTEMHASSSTCLARRNPWLFPHF
ncbi:MAG: tyrosine-type recombinase/integrase [Syntrophales bacterium LBB04]|nr:tyrosine-type recombinase/integrase [Syntrophales bacterium LBB04]